LGLFWNCLPTSGQGGKKNKQSGGKYMLETFLDLAKWLILIGLGVGFIFGGLVGLALFGGWLWDKLERIFK
jgi:hypothetical protein